MRCSSSRFNASRRIWFAPLAGLLILVATGSLCAQVSPDPDALSLEDLLNSKVYSASKYEQKATEAPSYISVITADDIRHWGYRTVQEALQSVTGFYVTNHGSYSTLGVRGFAPSGDANGRILFMVNGHTINNNIDDSAPIGNDFPIDMDLIDRIEIVRGPSSSLYGADAFMGVVNVITRTGKSQGEVISGEAGSLGTYKQTAIYGVDRGGTQAMVSASYWDTAAPGQLDALENPGGSTNSHDQTRRAMALVASHGFTLQAVASSAEEKVPSSPQWCGSCHQTDTHSTNFQGYADLRYEHRVWKSTQFSARTYYDNYEAKTSLNDRRNLAEGCTNKCHGPLLDYNSAHGDRVGAEMKLSRVFLDKHRITLGSEYRDNFHQAQNDNIVTPLYTDSKTFVNYDRTSAIWGIYGEAELHLLPKVVLNVGVRTDHYNYLFGSRTNPRATLIYNPLKSTTVKFLYGTAYRPPSFSELYYQGMATEPAPNLRPESIRSFEGDLEQRLGKHVTLSASGFYNNIGSYILDQTIENKRLVIDETTFSNSKASVKGGELELKGMLSSEVEGRLSYTYQDARNELTGASLPDAPRHLVKLNIAAPVFHRALTPAVEADYMSRSSTLWPSVGYSAPPVLVNASLSSRQFWRGFSASGGAYNLVGRSMGESTFGYFEQTQTSSATSLLPADRRTFRFKLTWTSGEHGAKDKDKKDESHLAGNR